MQKLKIVIFNMLIFNFNVLISLKSTSFAQFMICQPVDSVFQHVYFT